MRLVWFSSIVQLFQALSNPSFSLPTPSKNFKILIRSYIFSCGILNLRQLSILKCDGLCFQEVWDGGKTFGGAVCRKDREMWSFGDNDLTASLHMGMKRFVVCVNLHQLLYKLMWCTAFSYNVLTLRRYFETYYLSLSFLYGYPSYLSILNMK